MGPDLLHYVLPRHIINGEFKDGRSLHHFLVLQRCHSSATIVGKSGRLDAGDPYPCGFTRTRPVSVHVTRVTYGATHASPYPTDCHSLVAPCSLVADLIHTPSLPILTTLLCHQLHHTSSHSLCLHSFLFGLLVV